jgi:hypothetical protein
MIGVTGVVILLLIVAVVGRVYVFPKHPHAVTAGTGQPVLSFNAKQSADIDLVAGAVGQYAAANDALPTHLSLASNGDYLVLCGDSCDPTAYTVDGFSAYKPSSIKLVSYAEGLAAPDQNTMYLVPRAKCNTDGSVGSVNTDPRSMVILYATTSGSTVVPRCVVL